jgi:hypothetical protein
MLTSIVGQSSTLRTTSLDPTNLEPTGINILPTLLMLKKKMWGLSENNLEYYRLSSIHSAQMLLRSKLVLVSLFLNEQIGTSELSSAAYEGTLLHPMELRNSTKSSVNAMLKDLEDTFGKFAISSIKIGGKLSQEDKKNITVQMFNANLLSARCELHGVLEGSNWSDIDGDISDMKLDGSSVYQRVKPPASTTLEIPIPVPNGQVDGGCADLTYESARLVGQVLLQLVQQFSCTSKEDDTCTLLWLGTKIK